MSVFSEWIRKRLNEQFNPSIFNSFSTLTDEQLREVAKWGLQQDYSSGVWDDTDDEEEAVDMVVESFKRMIRAKYPEGFNGMPNPVVIYRMLSLKTPEDFNKNNVGYSWFVNPNRINDPDFKGMLDHLRSGNLYLITAKVPHSKIDIPRSLLQRDSISMENEIVLKDDTNIKIVSFKKIR